MSTEIKTLKTEVFEALGQVSMCWEPIPSGIFDSASAVEIGNKLLSKIESDVPNAINTITKALGEDAGYYLGWQSNIAMAFIDEIYRLSPVTKSWNRDMVHTIANNAAKKFLTQLCNKSIVEKNQ